MGKIISIINQKGGVGKTTIAFNLAAGLVENGHKTLLVDLDSQANATSYFGIEPDSVDLTIGDVILEKANISDILYQKQDLEFYLAPSNIALQEVEITLVTLPFSEKRLQKQIKNIKADFDFIIIDCPPHIGVMTANALVAAEDNLLVANPSVFSLQGISKLLRRMQELSDFSNKPIDISRVILNKCEGQTIIFREVLQSMKNMFSNKLFTTYIRKSIKVEESQAEQLPIFIYKENNIATQDFKKFIKEFLIWQGEKNHVQKRQLETSYS